MLQKIKIFNENLKKNPKYIKFEKKFNEMMTDLENYLKKEKRYLLIYTKTDFYYFFFNLFGSSLVALVFWHVLNLYAMDFHIIYVFREFMPPLEEILAKLPKEYVFPLEEILAKLPKEDVFTVGPFPAKMPNLKIYYYDVSKAFKLFYPIGRINYKKHFSDFSFRYSWKPLRYIIKISLKPVRKKNNIFRNLLWFLR